MPRRSIRRTDFDTRTRNMLEIAGKAGIGGLSRIGSGSAGVSGLPTSAFDLPETTEGAGNAQLLCLTTASDSIASGGDYVAVDSIVAQYGFETVVLVSGGVWIHPVSGVYVLTYEHAWDTYEGGGTIQLELDGEVATERTIASGTTGSKGQGTIAYVAQKGSAARIKVTQSSGSAQTCSGTAWVSISDPTEQAESEGAPPGSASVILFIDGVQVASASGDVGVSFSSATLLLGELASSPASASHCTFDEAQIISGGSNLLANSGFESALLTGTTSTAVASGNWRRYIAGGATTAARASSPVHAGSWAGDVNAAVGSGGWLHQDVALAPGDPFDIDVQVYRHSGQQRVSLYFDWDRTDDAPHKAEVYLGPTGSTFYAFGLSGSGPAIPAGEWHNVVLRVGVVA